MIELIRIDDLGVFAFPDGISIDLVKNIILDDKPIPKYKYFVLDNGNIDVVESVIGSVVKAELN